MRPLVVANFEQIETVQFVVALLYGEDGHLLDGLTLPCDSAAEALAVVLRLAGDHYGGDHIELWTSNTDIYGQSLKTAGVLGEIKHPSDTAATQTYIQQHDDILRDVFGIDRPGPEIVKPKPPKWRAFLIRQVRKLLKKLEGDGKFEI